MAALCPSLTPGGWQQPGFVSASSTNTGEPRATAGTGMCREDLWQYMPKPDCAAAWPGLGGSWGACPDPLCFGRLCSPTPATQLSMLQPPSEGSCSSSGPATCGGCGLGSCRTDTQPWPLATGRASPALSMPPSRTLWATSGFSKVRVGL